MIRLADLARTLTLAAVIAMAAVACGAAQPTGSPTPAPSGVVSITASEFKFDPATLTVPAGLVAFSVRNGGNIEHEFDLYKGDQLVGDAKAIAPGSSRDLSVTLEAGEYTYVCKIAGHEGQGMKGTLVVTGG